MWWPMLQRRLVDPISKRRPSCLHCIALDGYAHWKMCYPCREEMVHLLYTYVHGMRRRVSYLVVQPALKSR
jgi:hypothetical protein